MNKKAPAYDLSTIKQALSSVSKLRMTGSAQQTMFALGLVEDDVINVIQALTPADFYKSMAPQNPKFIHWQDVYRPYYQGLQLYVKFQLGHNGQVVISFKEK